MKLESSQLTCLGTSRLYFSNSKTSFFGSLSAAKSQVNTLVQEWCHPREGYHCNTLSTTEQRQLRSDKYDCDSRLDCR